MIFNTGCALLIFAGAVSLAYYAEEARGYISLVNDDRAEAALRDLANTLGAAAVSTSVLVYYVPQLGFANGSITKFQISCAIYH